MRHAKKQKGIIPRHRAGSAAGRYIKRVLGLAVVGAAGYVISYSFYQGNNPEYHYDGQLDTPTGQASVRFREEGFPFRGRRNLLAVDEPDGTRIIFVDENDDMYPEVKGVRMPDGTEVYMIDATAGGAAPVKDEFDYFLQGILETKRGHYSEANK